MRKFILVVLIYGFMCGCATKKVEVQLPTDPTTQIEAVAKSDMNSADKKEAINNVLITSERKDKMALDRENAKGANLKEGWMQLLTLIGTGISLGASIWK